MSKSDKAWPLADESAEWPVKVLDAAVFVWSQGVNRWGYILAGNEVVMDEISDVGSRCLEDLAYGLKLPETDGIHLLHGKLIEYPEDDPDWKLLSWNAPSEAQLRALAFGKPIDFGGSS